MTESLPGRPIPVRAGSGVGALVPQSAAAEGSANPVDFFFRSRQTLASCRLSVTADGKEIFSRRYETVRPPEMEKVTLDLSLLPPGTGGLLFSLLPDECGSVESETAGYEIIDETVCIECPRGCRLRIGRRPDGSIAVFGNSCPKGKLYGERETENPHRVLTTTVKTVFGGCPRLAVRTDGPIPRSALKDAQRLTDAVTVREAVLPGTVLIQNFGGWGVNLIAASECHP